MDVGQKRRKAARRSVDRILEHARAYARMVAQAKCGKTQRKRELSSEKARTRYAELERVIESELAAIASGSLNSIR